MNTQWIDFFDGLSEEEFNHWLDDLYQGVLEKSKGQAFVAYLQRYEPEAYQAWAASRQQRQKAPWTPLQIGLTAIGALLVIGSILFVLVNSGSGEVIFNDGRLPTPIVDNGRGGGNTSPQATLPSGGGGGGGNTNTTPPPTATTDYVAQGETRVAEAIATADPNVGGGNGSATPDAAATAWDMTQVAVAVQT